MQALQMQRTLPHKLYSARYAARSSTFHHPRNMATCSHSCIGAHTCSFHPNNIYAGTGRTTRHNSTGPQATPHTASVASPPIQFPFYYLLPWCLCLVHQPSSIDQPPPCTISSSTRLFFKYSHPIYPLPAYHTICSTLPTRYTPSLHRHARATSLHTPTPTP